MTSNRTRNSLRKYLMGIASSATRTRIRKAAFRRGFVIGKIGTAEKAILAESIFEVENEVEHMVGEYPPGAGGEVTAKRREWVRQMRMARNRLYDDLGWNEFRA